MLRVAARQVSAERRFDGGLGLVEGRRCLTRPGRETNEQKPRRAPNPEKVHH
jgi:hypothetical protein